MNRVQTKLKFLEIVDEMKNIKRAIFLQNEEKESNAEHSYDLAFMVMLFTEDFPKLDKEKCYKMALLHDIVEVYAGDTVIFDEKMEQTKEQREKEAIKTFEKELGEKFFSPYKKLLEEYEAGETLDAKFVRQIDKLHPIIQIVNEGGTSWKEYKILKNKLIEKKRSQIDDTFGLRKVLDAYFEKAEENNLFYEGN